MILDLFEAATGDRMVNNHYFRIGGVAADLPFGWVDKCQDFCNYFYPLLMKVKNCAKKYAPESVFRINFGKMSTTYL